MGVDPSDVEFIEERLRVARERSKARPLLLPARPAANPQPPLQERLPLRGRKLKPVLPAEPEHALQHRVVEVLRTVYHLEVLETNLGPTRHPCPACGFWHHGSGGHRCTPGVPDILVRSRGSGRLAAWPPSAWLAVELKGVKTPLSREQRNLESDGSVSIARSVDAAVVAVRRFHESLGLPWTME